MKFKAIVLLAAVAAAHVAAGTFLGRANARSEHNTAFKSHYLADKNNEALVTAVGETKCYVCHDNNPRDDNGKIDVENGKKDKEYLNVYGKALAQLITTADYEAYKDARSEKPDDKDALKAAFVQKSIEALIAVGATEASPGVTYDQLFEQGKMPAQPTD